MKKHWDNSYNLSNSIFPQTPIFSPTIITAPFIPGSDSATFRLKGISSAFFTLLPTAVATESAKAVEGDTMVTASALPKLKDGPTVPDEVQTPSGISEGNTLIPIFSERGDAPANILTIISSTVDTNISPPFSTITSEEYLKSDFPTNSAIAPATAAIGPTPTSEDARSISFTINGA